MAAHIAVCQPTREAASGSLFRKQERSSSLKAFLGELIYTAPFSQTHEIQALNGQHPSIDEHQLTILDEKSVWILEEDLCVGFRENGRRGEVQFGFFGVVFRKLVKLSRVLDVNTRDLGHDERPFLPQVWKVVWAGLKKDHVVLLVNELTK